MVELRILCTQDPPPVLIVNLTESRERLCVSMCSSLTAALSIKLNGVYAKYVTSCAPSSSLTFNAAIGQSPTNFMQFSMVPYGSRQNNLLNR